MSSVDEFTATVSTLAYSSSTTYDTQIWSNFGPLTTTYTAPEVCQSDPANLGLIAFTITAPNSTATSYDCKQAGNNYIQNPACYPSSSAVQDLREAALSVLFGAYYSPGIYCPSAWTTAASGTFQPTASSVPPWIDPMIGNQNMNATFLWCCPSGYSLSGGPCVSPITTPTYGAMCALSYSCSSSGGVAGSVCGSNAEVFDWNPSKTSTEVAVSVYPIAMVQQDSDLMLSSSHTENTHTFKSPHSSTPAALEGSGGSDEDAGSSSSSAKVIIPAVVVPVVALIAFIAAVIFCLRARKRRARTRAEGSSYHNYTGVSQWQKGVGSDITTANGDGHSSWQGSNWQDSNSQGTHLEPLRR